MKYILKIILLSVALTCFNSLWANEQHQDSHEKNYFQFTIPKYHTTRQSGQTLNIYVKYAYKNNLPTSEYPDYRLLRAQILKYMEPSDELPMNVFWEVLATEMGRELIKDYPLQGVSIQLEVFDNQTPESYEPGVHGAIYTIGKIAPLNIH